MKQFIFDEDECCINPNRYPVGNKEFYAEVLTGCEDGRWYYGYWYWTRGHSFKISVYLHTSSKDTEREAILKATEHLIKMFNEMSEDKFRPIEIPLRVLKDLRDLYNEWKTPQMKLF